MWLQHASIALLILLSFWGHLHTGSGWSAGVYLLKWRRSCVSRGIIDRGFFARVLHEGSSRQFLTTVLDDGSSNLLRTVV